MTPEKLRATLRRLVEAPVPGDVAARAAALERASRRLLDPEDPLTRELVEVLPSATGFSEAMVQACLPRVFGPVRRRVIEEVVAGASGVVDLVVVVSAGNVLGVALPKAVLALAAGASVFGKLSSGEPHVLPFFARALETEDPLLGARIATGAWRGGRRDLEGILAKEANTLVAYGSDATLAALESLGPRRFVGHGHRVSLAVVRLDRERPGDLADRIALDVALYDQMGCLSPQTIFLVGGTEADHRRFGWDVVQALDRLSPELPRCAVDESTALAIRRFRDEAEWRKLSGGEGELWSGSEWTVCLSAEAVPENPLHRTIVLTPVEAPEDLGGVASPWRGRIESLGVAPWPDPGIEETVRSLDIPRVVPLGEMQEPGLDWRQGGLDPLAGIVEG